MQSVRFGGGEPDAALRQFLAQERVLGIGIWIHVAGDPPSPLAAGPWLVVTEQELTAEERQAWLAVLDEESSLVECWTPASLKRSLKSSFIDSSRLARLYAQGGRALADHMVRNFLKHSVDLVQRAESEWSQDPESARQHLHHLQQLAGSVGASELQDLLAQAQPDWDRLHKELESTRRIFDHQHRQDRTV